MTRTRAVQVLVGAAWTSTVMVVLKLAGPAGGSWWLALSPVPIVLGLLGLGWTVVTFTTFVIAMLENRDQHRR